MPMLDGRDRSSNLARRFETLGDLAARQLAGIAIPVIFPAGETIFTEGDSAGRFFVISKGIARVFRRRPDGGRQVAGFLYAGDFMGVNSRQRHIFGIEATTAVSALSFRMGDVERLMYKNTELQHMFLSDAFSELEAAQDQMLVLGRESASERVASFLLLLCRRQPLGITDSRDRIALPDNMVNIADYLDVAPETVKRCLRQFRHDGVIRKSPSWREIEILRWEELLKFSAGYSL